MATLSEVLENAVDALGNWMPGYTETVPQERCTWIDSRDDHVIVQYFCRETGESQMFRVTALVEFYDASEA